jgi:3-phosphoglycerate kinase
MERMVNRVFILGNLGEKSGKIKGEDSMKIIQHELQQHIHDVPIHYLHDPNSDEFKEKKSMDELADNCIYVVENLNFHPHEFGYVEPDTKPPPPEENTAQDPPKEENSQPLSKGEKKGTSGKPMSDAGEEVKEIEEPVPEEPEEEKFNSHTIHRFKKSLGNLGQIYVNDAPLASLTNSNTVSEIKCPQKVMGMKMTEEMRNIAQFFMK